MSANPGRVAIQYLDGRTHHVEALEGCRDLAKGAFLLKGLPDAERLELLFAAYLSELTRQTAAAQREGLNQTLAKTG